MTDAQTKQAPRDRLQAACTEGPDWAEATILARVHARVHTHTHAHTHVRMHAHSHAPPPQVHFSVVDLELHARYVPGTGESVFERDQKVALRTQVGRDLEMCCLVCAS